MLITAAQLPDGRRRDIRITDGSITAVEQSLALREDEVLLDAAGRTLMPGAIDVHVHFREPGYEHKETFHSGSRAAAAGGVTTVVDQPNTNPPTISGSAFDEKAIRAAESLVDYGLNGGVTDAWEPETLLERPLFALGEVFMADSTGSMGIADETFVAAVRRASEADIPVTVHAEDSTHFDPTALDGATGIGRDADADRWSRYRPPAAEITAVERAISAAADADAQLHVAHTSTPEAIDRAAAATDVTCEVTPHHAFLSREDATELGTFGRMNPPLRSESARSAVFERIADGTVDLMATDHAPHTREEKQQSLTDAPSGVPGVETMVPLLLAAVRDGQLSLERVRDLVAANPAAVFDLSAKGRIEPGRDADLALYDLDRVTQIDGEQLHSACSWTPFAGQDGVFPLATLVRGELVYVAPEANIQAPFDGPFGPAIGRNVRS